MVRFLTNLLIVITSPPSSLALARISTLPFISAFLSTKRSTYCDNIIWRHHQHHRIRNCAMPNTKMFVIDSIGDAEAYHEMASAAVDLTSVYFRNNMISAIRSVRDIDSNSRRSFLYNIPLMNKESSPFIPPPTELPFKIRARIPSPSGLKLAILVEESLSSVESSVGGDMKRNVFEIWTDHGNRLANRILLSKENHGPVCTDIELFGGIAWSLDESVLVYNAEVPRPKSVSFFDNSSTELKEGKIVGGQNTLGVGKIEDWGEKYLTTGLLALFCLNVDTGKVGIIANVPGSSVFLDPSSTDGGFVLGQAVFSPCGKSVVYTAWDAGGGGNMPRRLGAIYCFQRPCKIYSSPVTELLSQLSNPNSEKNGVAVDDPFVCITPNDRIARSPRLSKIVNASAKLAYLCNTKGFDTHGGCVALVVSDWDVSLGSVVKDTQEVIVDIVSLPGERGDQTMVSGIKFPGLFLSQLPEQCFSPDLDYIVTTTEWGSTTKIVSISLANGSVTPINFDVLRNDDRKNANDSSQRFFCFTDDGGAIVAQSEVNHPTVLGFLPPTFLKRGELFSPSHILTRMLPCSSSSFSSPLTKESLKSSMSYSYQIINTQPQHGDITVPVSSILLLPQNSENEKIPLIVIPHGGPHTCVSTSYERAGMSCGFLCRHGRYAVLHVNFRGSTGFGQAAIESLPGNAGSFDVLDVVSATNHVINMGIIDSDRIGVCGGSHGGFLAAHLIGKHSDIFKVAAMRNPCVNIATMVTATDIPDWCYIETLGIGKYNFSEFHPPCKEELIAMWEKSPIIHLEHVKAPTLIALGMKDRRVPPSQGIEYFHALRAKGIPTKLLVYEDCDHAIDRVASETDFFINVKQWFDQYL